jgi:hypothetical protein
MLMLIWAAAGVATEPNASIAHNNMFRMTIIQAPDGMISLRRGAARTAMAMF